MSDKRILVVEDDPTISKIFQEVLINSGYNVTIAHDGKDALQKFNEDPFSVVITDLEMPIMDGRELIENLFNSKDDAMIIVETSHNDISTVIEVMKKGVYDYFVKPVNYTDMLIKVKRAFETYDLRHLKKIRDKEKILRLENQMSWYKYQEKAKGNSDTKDKLKFHKSLFDSLKTNFSQGAGFGIMVSLAELIAGSPKNDQNEYLISSEIIDLFLSNIKVTERALSVFAEIDFVISNPVQLEMKSLKDFYNTVQSVKGEISNFLEIRKQKILISDPKPIYSNLFMEFNESLIQKTVKELFMNAMKFSTNDSKIIAIIEVNDTSVQLSVINQPVPDKRGAIGIGEEYQNIIFEPFFRLWDHTFEEFETLDYGLGLTFIDKIIEKHKGSVSVTNLLDHSGLRPEQKVEFTISIPLTPKVIG